jgi:hypothetical protein
LNKPRIICVYSFEGDGSTETTRTRLRNFVRIVGLTVLVALAGCGHRLVVTNGDKAIFLYRDEATYLSLRQSQQAEETYTDQLLDHSKKLLSSKMIDDQTKVSIISTTGNGFIVEIEEGLYTGERGFVPLENVR